MIYRVVIVGVVGVVVLLGKLVPAMQSRPAVQGTGMLRMNVVANQEIKQSPALAQALKGKSGTEYAVALQELARPGLRRLTYGELIAWNNVRLHLAEQSPVLCAAFWTGRGLTSQLVYGVLNQLPSDESDTFARLTVRAAVSEVEKQSFSKVPEDAFARVLPQVKKLHAPADAQRLEKVVAAGVNAADDDGCWAQQLLMRDSAQLQPLDRDMFLRFFASL